jgi:kynurenine formamidase
MFAGIYLLGCSKSIEEGAPSLMFPTEIIDLGILVTEDIPESLWGKRFLTDMGFDRNNAFEVIDWEFAGGAVTGSNAYLTLFNHGGPHVDAPNHVGLGAGIDSYDIEAFVGPLKVIDATQYGPGRTVPMEAFSGQDIQPGDIVIMYTSYQPPQSDDEYPQIISLKREAAEYLAEIPVRAFGTNSMSVESITDQSPIDTDSPLIQAIPIHHSFLSRNIPVFETLVNVHNLLGKQNMYFVGPPLNIKDSDGMMVRPVVLVY